ncbi:Hypothetical protein PHPALM_10348 [Phytophthora palmivora]|uniref:Uncharacterized protein n=1 Tax=Phytophthora palmivora TaxID=4796 RepID=A0A2P4Y4Y3_9STRA|nr:Hypothetical protein PHPALM_10348 [Phytophthora palmivora]
MRLNVESQDRLDFDEDLLPGDSWIQHHRTNHNRFGVMQSHEESRGHNQRQQAGFCRGEIG